MSENKATFEKNGRWPAEVPNPEVMAQAKRRQFTAEYKQRILAEADQCQERGEIGSLILTRPIVRPGSR